MAIHVKNIDLLLKKLFIFRVFYNKIQDFSPSDLLLIYFNQFLVNKTSKGGDFFSWRDFTSHIYI